MTISKPGGMSSFDVIRHLKKILPRQTKLGHAGTLDPAAEGLLLVLVGEATRVQHLLKDLDKEYVAGVRLGLETDTLDKEGKVLREEPVGDIDEETVRRALEGLKGKRMQRPPSFSAIKVEGRRSYERARAGEDFELAEREVVIHEIELLSWEIPVLAIKTRVSSGTYIRSLAKEIGAALGLPASLEYLRRTRIGPFSLENARELENLSLEKLGKALIPLKELLKHLPQEEADDDTTAMLLQGKPVTSGIASTIISSPQSVLYSRDGRRAFLCESRDGKLWSRRLLYDDGAPSV